jgi:hypothetical protein
MATWIIKSQTYNLNDARDLVADLRNRGYEAVIEDESGRSVSEAEEKNNVQQASRALYDRLVGFLVVVGAVVVGIGGLYLIGLWVDKD